MKLFTKKIFVIILSTLIVIFSTFLSVNIKLTKEFTNVTEGFYKGVFVNGKRDTSIHSQLLIIARESGVLADIAARNGIDAENIREEADQFTRDVTTMDDDISYIHYSYKELLNSINELGEDLRSINLSENDEAAAVSSLSNIIEAQKLIEASGYNESIRKYLNSLHFPAEFFADVVGADPPEYFA